MKTFQFFCIFVLLLFLAPSNTIAQGMIAFSGTVTTFDTKTVEGLLCQTASRDGLKSTPIADTVQLVINNSAGQRQGYDVETALIDKIIYSGKRLGENNTNFIVVLKNGKSLELINQSPILMPKGAIYVSSRHPVTGALSFDRIYWANIKEIRLHEPYGQVRQDDHGNVFPADYEYSPYTGQPMLLHKLD